MATHFPESIGVPIVDQEDRITRFPLVPNYDAFQRSIVVAGEGESFPIGSIEPLRVAIEPTTDYIYVTDFKNGLIHIFSQTGDHINHFGDPYLTWPWGILIHLDNIFVTDTQHHVIFLIRLPDLKMMKKVCKRGSGRKEFDFPTQLAISPNQNLYVTDTYNNRLQILTTDFKFTDSLQHRTMSRPVDVKFSNNEIFVLSDTDTPCVHLFTLSGEKTISLVTRGDGMQVRSPIFFCLDGHNNILISEYSSRSIEVFSPAGDLLHTIGQKKQVPESYISYPLCITLLNNDQLVTTNSNYEINIFSTRNCTNLLER